MGQETNIKNENDSTSNNEEESSKDSSVQVSSSDTNEEVVLNTKVEDIIGKSDESIDVHDNLSVYYFLVMRNKNIH
jgi:hypothetical protein